MILIGMVDYRNFLVRGAQEQTSGPEIRMPCVGWNIAAHKISF